MIEEIENFEQQSVQTIAYNMVKWLDFKSVNISYEERKDVESGVWIVVEFSFIDYSVEDNTLCQLHVYGQRNDIVRKRLIDLLRARLGEARGNKNDK